MLPIFVMTEYAVGTVATTFPNLQNNALLL